MTGKEKRKKVLYFEEWVKIDCPFCKKKIALSENKLPETVFCDNCLKTFKLKEYEVKERRIR